MGCVTFHLALKFYAASCSSTAGNFGGQALVSHLLNYRQNFSINYKFYTGIVLEIMHQTLLQMHAFYIFAVGKKV